MSALDKSNFLQRPAMDGQIEVGTVGWTDEPDHVIVGEDGSDEEGYTLIKVQLMRGRNITKPLIPGVGQGHPMLCHLSSAIGRIPPKGTRCYVAIPNGMSNTTSGVIIATIEKNAADQLSATRAVIDYGSQDLVIKAASITLMDNDGKFITVNPNDGVKMSDENGNLMQINGGDAFIATSDSVNITSGTLAGISIVGGATPDVSLFAGATMLKLDGVLQMGTWVSIGISLACASGSFGATASPATPATVFPAAPSGSIFIQL